jgi:hypothetical protein
MAETHLIERMGKEILRKHLIAAGRKIEDSDDRTFDLIVDGHYAEMKVKKYGWDKLDFIHLTVKQKEALGKKLKTIFVVLNIDQPDQTEIIEIDANDLLQCKSQEIISYEWNKGDIRHLRRLL